MAPTPMAGATPLPPGPAPQPPGCDDQLPPPPALATAPPTRLERGEVLGQGAVGRVFRGRLHDQPAVIKEAGSIMSS